MVGIKIEINFLFLRTTSVAKSTYEPKWESAQNIGTKSVFLPIYIYIQAVETTKQGFGRLLQYAITTLM